MSTTRSAIRDAGSLDRQIELQHFTETQDEFGGVTLAWTTLATVWAQVRELRGSERVEAAQLAATVDAYFIIRYRTDIIPKMRILYEGDVFDIREVLELPRRQGLQLEALWRDPAVAAAP